MTTSRTGALIVGCLVLAVIALAIIWPHEEPVPPTIPGSPDQTSSREGVIDQLPPEELTTGADDGEGDRNASSPRQTDDLNAADSHGGEDDADLVSTRQDGGAGPDANGSDAATQGQPVSIGDGSADDPSDAPPSDGAVGPTEGQDAPPDDVAESEGDGGGKAPLPELPTPPPLPHAEDVSSVEGTVVPEDVGSAQETITGVWRQVGGSGAADFLPGGYVASEFAFLADGTIRIRRTFDKGGDIVMTWRVSYEWNESETELTVGLGARPTPASLRGFTIRESNVQATSATQDLPCVLKCVRSDDGQIRLADKTYAPAE